MSKLNITQYEHMGRDPKSSPVPVGENSETVSDDVSFTSSSVQSDAFNVRTSFVRLVSSADCRLSFGVNPTAAATDVLLVAGQSEYFGLNGKYSLRVAVIEDA